MNKYIRDGRAPIPESEITSKIMSANKGSNTKPEIFLRKAIWKLGLRGYRLHQKNIPGRPDVAFTKIRLAIFINGCFWHRCPHCNLALPKSNKDFWIKKFERNIERDKMKINELKNIGWESIIIWECQLKKDLKAQVDKIRKIYEAKGY